MLCFDVKIDKEAQQYADEVGVKIFSAEIIYHLFDNFTAHQKVGCLVFHDNLPYTNYVP
jgi:translation initiation factor 5B